MISRVIIFDMDGVLINSKFAHAEAFNLAFKQNNLRPFPWERIIKQFGPPSKVIIKKLFPEVTDRKLDSVINDKREFLLNQTFRLSKQIEGAETVLFNLKKNYKLALVTNSQRDEIFSLLKAGGIDTRLFDLILGAEDMVKPKPDPEIVSKVERLLKGVVKYIVGDQIEDLRLAQATDVKFIGVDSGVEDLDSLADAGANIIIKSIAILPEIIRESEQSLP